MPSDLLNVVNVIWYGIALGLLLMWLVRTRWAKEALTLAPSTHHSIGVIEILLTLYIVIVSRQIALYGQTHFEDPHWQPNDLIYALLILIFLAGPACLLIPAIRAKLPTGCFGLTSGGPRKLLTKVVIYFVTFQGLTLLTLGITIAVCNRLGYEELQVHETLDKLKENPTWRGTILLVVPAIVIAPVFEECLFRGLMQTFIIRLPGLIGLWLKPPSEAQGFYDASALPITPTARWMGIVASSVAFAISHANGQHAPALFVLSVGLGYSYERQGNLVVPILIHAIFNTIPIALLLIMPESA